MNKGNFLLLTRLSDDSCIIVNASILERVAPTDYTGIKGSILWFGLDNRIDVKETVAEIWALLNA